MKSEDLIERTKRFAHGCVKFALSLPEDSLCRHIKNQLIRCSTSVAANYRATCLSQSKKTFIAKVSIVVEEIDEVCFWLEFILEERIFPLEKIESLSNEGRELTAIFIASRKTATSNINRQ